MLSAAPLAGPSASVVSYRGLLMDGCNHEAGPMQSSHSSLLPEAHALHVHLTGCEPQRPGLQVQQSTRSRWSKDTSLDAVRTGGKSPLRLLVSSSTQFRLDWYLSAYGLERGLQAPVLKIGAVHLEITVLLLVLNMDSPSQPWLLPRPQQPVWWTFGCWKTLGSQLRCMIGPSRLCPTAS